ncbi:AraC family transcriptional regulator [Chryseobacterium sp.]|uniref:helix-turn-helix domain-containing protein n=1 Tax=Chryseobacterium sp. TaxID=1871047 RepID=UPI0025C6A213|nr:AraC family transcriptional regulator [Chryseobacterium sp.]
MNTIILPDELDIEISKSIQLFDYNGKKEIYKQQIVLNKNAISFLIEGSKEIIFNDSSLIIDNSKFLMMKSGNCLMTEKLSDARKYRSILLFFSNEVLLSFIRKMGLNTTQTFEPNSVFPFQYDEFTTLFAKSLSDILNLSGRTQQNLLDLKFEEIMIYLMDKYGKNFILSMVNNSNNTDQKFIRTIENNLLNKLTIKELSFLCGMSVSSFKRAFQNYYSESPGKWFQQKRLEHAHYLLQHERKNSSEIFFELGYENLSSFIQAYKIKYGMTPKQHHKI